MENRNHIEELVVKSLLNELDHEEEAMLAAWLEASAQNRQYYEALQHAWLLTGVQHTVSSIQANEEWDRFQQSVQQQPARTPLYRKMGGWAVAASVLLVLALGWYWWSAKEPVRQTSPAPVAKTTITTRKQINTTDAEQRYRLPDGSEIWLAKNSELMWQEPFERRNIYLKGMARFNVAKDSSKPFSVACSKLTVTVLGTVFSVNDYDSARSIIIRLFEGKVLVQSTDIKDTYLQPGQELVYDKASKTAIVNRFTERTPVVPRNSDIVQPYDDPPLPYNERGNWYMFNNQSLAEVFDQLQQIYDVTIKYNDDELEKLYFIGKFSKSDSIETILRQIATLNQLTVVKESNTFIIRK